MRPPAHQQTSPLRRHTMKFEITLTETMPREWVDRRPPELF